MTRSGGGALVDGQASQVRALERRGGVGDVQAADAGTNLPTLLADSVAGAPAR